MNKRQKKFLHLIIIECKANRQKLIELWEKSDKWQVRENYLQYRKELYQGLKAEHSDLSPKEIRSMIKEKWKGLSDCERSKYMVLEEKKPRKKTAYQNFFKQNYSKIKSENTEWKLPQVSREVSKQWKLLSDQEKLVYTTTTVDEKYEKIKSVHEEKVKSDNKPVEVEAINEDLYLDESEKNEIMEMIQNNFAEKNIETLCKLVKDNYNENCPKNITKESILKKLYQLEREEKIKSKLEMKCSLIPKELLKLEKEELTLMEEKRTSLDNMEFWGVELQYRNTLPEQETQDDLEQLSKDEMIEKILENEKNSLLKIKTYKIMDIRC